MAQVQKAAQQVTEHVISTGMSYVQQGQELLFKVNLGEVVPYITPEKVNPNTGKVSGGNTVLFTSGGNRPLPITINGVEYVFKFGSTGYLDGAPLA
jgi:hypothetical protein